VAHHEAPYNEDILAHIVKKSSVSACITSAHSTYTRLCGQVYVQVFAGESDRKKDDFQ
jgi:hypothetical protein